MWYVRPLNIMMRGFPTRYHILLHELNLIIIYLQNEKCMTRNRLPFPLPYTYRIVDVNGLVDPGQRKHDMGLAVTDVTYLYTQEQSRCRQEGKLDKPQYSGHIFGKRQGNTSVCSMHRNSRPGRLKHQCTQQSLSLHSETLVYSCHYHHSLKHQCTQQSLSLQPKTPVYTAVTMTTAWNTNVHSSHYHYSLKHQCTQQSLSLQPETPMHTAVTITTVWNTSAHNSHYHYSLKHQCTQQSLSVQPKTSIYTAVTIISAGNINVHSQYHNSLKHQCTQQSVSLQVEIVREPGGPTVHPPPPPPPPPGTFHYGSEMYLRVSRTQSYLFPWQPLGCTGVIALCARVPLAFSQSLTECRSLMHHLNRLYIIILWYNGPM